MRSTLLCKWWLVKQGEEISPILFLSSSSLYFPFSLVLILQLHAFFSWLQLPSFLLFLTVQNWLCPLNMNYLDMIELGQFQRDIWKKKVSCLIFCATLWNSSQLSPHVSEIVSRICRTINTNYLKNSPTNVFGPLNSCLLVA